jgi:hypothetical protein
MTIDDRPRILLSRDEAAAALGMSVRHFARFVQGDLRCVRVGARKLYAVDELHRWVDRRADPAGAAEAARA